MLSLRTTNVFKEQTAIVFRIQQYKMPHLRKHNTKDVDDDDDGVDGDRHE
jgi:hypothetical protein